MELVSEILGVGLGPGGPDSTLRPPKAADETPHFGAESAEIKKNSVFDPKNGIFGQKGPKSAFFSKNCSKIQTKFENFRKILALMKPHRPKKWPKNAIKMKVSGVDETPEKARPPNNYG